jgi:putative flippase GtrA
VATTAFGGPAVVPPPRGLDRCRPRGILSRLLASTGGRFLLVGGISFLANQALLALLYEHLLAQAPSRLQTAAGALDARLLLASCLAVEGSILLRFLLNDNWTFRKRRRASFRRRLYASNFGSLGSPLIALACVNLLTPLTGISYLVTNALGVLLGLGWNWLWSSRVVWRAANDRIDFAERGTENGRS